MPDGHVAEGIGEKSILKAHPGDVVQLERFGFVRLEDIAAGIKAYFAHR